MNYSTYLRIKWPPISLMEKLCLLTIGNNLRTNEQQQKIKLCKDVKCDMLSQKLYGKSYNINIT